MKEAIKSILSSNKDSISSKRVCGLIGWAIGLIILVYCTINQIQAPDMVDTMLYCCMGLLGIDSITGAFKKEP